MSGIARFHPAGLPGFSNIKKAAKSLGFLRLSITTKNFPESPKLVKAFLQLKFPHFQMAFSKRDGFRGNVSR
jgi:hypothetical protein